MKAYLQSAKNKKGQSLVEYALILAIVAAVAVAVMIALGTRVKSVSSTTSSQLSAAQNSH